MAAATAAAQPWPSHVDRLSGQGTNAAVAPDLSGEDLGGPKTESGEDRPWAAKPQQNHYN